MVDLKQTFFDQCDEAHRAFFGDLISRWKAAGQEVIFGSSSVVLKTHKKNICSLHPSYRKKGGAAKFNIKGLRKDFGDQWADGLADDIRSISGMRVGKGQKELVVSKPARASLNSHEAFKQVLLRRV